MMCKILLIMGHLGQGARPRKRCFAAERIRHQKTLSNTIFREGIFGVAATGTVDQREADLEGPSVGSDPKNKGTFPSVPIYAPFLPNLLEGKYQQC